MNYFTLFPLSGYWGKFLGLAISAPALLLLAVYKMLGPDYLPSVISAKDPITTLIYFFCLGLLIITFSKEKVDDERVQKIRYTALRAMAYFNCIGVFSVLAPFSNNKEEVADSVMNGDVFLIFLLLVLPLLVYQIIFNIGLYLNPGWVFNDLGAEENIRKNPKFFLIYTILVSIMVVIFIILRNN